MFRYSRVMREVHDHDHARHSGTHMAPWLGCPYHNGSLDDIVHLRGFWDFEENSFTAEYVAYRRIWSGRVCAPLASSRSALENLRRNHERTIPLFPNAQAGPTSPHWTECHKINHHTLR